MKSLKSTLLSIAGLFVLGGCQDEKGTPPTSLVHNMKIEDALAAFDEAKLKGRDQEALKKQFGAPDATRGVEWVYVHAPTLEMQYTDWMFVVEWSAEGKVVKVTPAKPLPK